MPTREPLGLAIPDHPNAGWGPALRDAMMFLCPLANAQTPTPCSFLDSTQSFTTIRVNLRSKAAVPTRQVSFVNTAGGEMMKAASSRTPGRGSAYLGPTRDKAGEFCKGYIQGPETGPTPGSEGHCEVGLGRSQVVQPLW